MKFTVIRGTVLGIDVYRGFARLSDLAKVSQPDIYDQESNPSGTQRDLSPRHAREAYEYVKTCEEGFFPEIILNARSLKPITFVSFNKSHPDVGMLTVNRGEIERIGGTVISRVDGNHRLHYADGHDERFPALDREVGFAVIWGLAERDSEIELLLFRDINANQKGMNTSHLDSIALRTSSEHLKWRDPELYIAEQLMGQEESPFQSLVYRGGVRPGGFMIPLRNLKTSVQYMRQRSKWLPQMKPEAQTTLAIRYWQAVKEWIPEAWHEPKKHIALRSTGFWAISFIGADVIDRAVDAGTVSPDEMLAILRSGQDWDWSNGGDFRGYGGRAGAVEIANLVTGEFEARGASLRDLEKELISANGS